MSDQDIGRSGSARGADHQHPSLAVQLSAVEDFICRYVALPSPHERVAVTLWVAHSHLVEQFETSPILAITSAEKRSGKTRLLDCLELLVPTPYRAVTPSEAVVYTILAQRPRPTLLLDEVDAIFGRGNANLYEGIRAILNAGNRAGTPVLRVKMDGGRRVEAFDVYGPKAVAGIGDLPDTIADRAIPIRLKRRSRSEPIERFRRRVAAAEAAAIAYDWEALGTLGTDGTVPDELGDRAADSWEPLIWIADAAGGGWPRRSRLAAIALSSEETAPATLGDRLLGDIRHVFGDTSYLPTAELLNGLCRLEAAPWSDWNGKTLTARALAQLLEPYRIGPKNPRLPGERRARCYYRNDFLDAWSRYLPESVPAVPTVPQAVDSSDLPTESDYPSAAWDISEES